MLEPADRGEVVPSLVVPAQPRLGADQVRAEVSLAPRASRGFPPPLWELGLRQSCPWCSGARGCAAVSGSVGAALESRF